MNKITKKLFRYFSLMLLFLSATVFAGFAGIFYYYTFQHHALELEVRAQTIKQQLEQFMGAGPKQGKGAYLRFVDDIALADVYIVGTDGAPFSWGKWGHKAVGASPTQEVKDFASHLILGNGPQDKKGENHVERYQAKDADGNRVIFVGTAVYEDGKAAAAVVICDTMDVHYNSFRFAIILLAAVLSFFLILSGILSIFLSRRFILPIQQIARATKELARGNYTARTCVQDTTELGELAQETDLLAGELELARQERSKMEQMQQDYISNISHELRTPVAVIRSSLEAVCDGVVKGEKAAQYLRQMLAESISLQRLVNDMLELSRLQNMDFPIEKAPMDLCLALEDAVRAVRVLAQEKQVQVQYEKSRAEWLMEGDYGRLRQMFVAVLDNAIKYSQDGGHIQVETEAGPEKMHIIVRDFGCGISEEDQAHIFEKFYRSAQNQEKGSGLGLAIAKSIAQRHQITIGLDSVCGQGTQVAFCVLRHF